MVYKFFDKKTSGEAVEVVLNKESTEELHKRVTRKFEKRKVPSYFMDNICGPDK